jgi:hypothetical protein
MNRYMHPLNQSMHRARQNSRMRDIQESQGLLLELVTTEPTILQCFKIIESTCLSQGIFCRLQGAEVSPAFQRFLDDHYLPFCKTAIRAMFTYGFVPWRTRKLGRGDVVPEVLPPGTFSWHTEVGPDEQARAPSKYYHHHGGSGGSKRRRAREPQHPQLAMPDDDDSRLVVYKITPSAGGVREEDVFVYISAPPALDVSANSSLYATVPSPLSYLLTDYKNLREAQKRRSHADAWNTTARIVSTFKPNLRTEDNPSQYLMDFVHEDHYSAPAIGESLFPNIQAHNVWQREHIMRRQIMETPSNHHPEVYALPRDHDVVAQPHLDPCEDLTFLLDKYRRDVSALTGVPHEMIIGRDNGNHETVRKTIASGRIFSTNMHEICRHIQALLRTVYCEIYATRPEDVEFLLVPMPRLEIETIQDFKVLHEIGALTPDMTVKLSRILLGEEPGASRQSKRRAVEPGEPFPEKKQVAMAGPSSEKKQVAMAGPSSEKRK